MVTLTIVLSLHYLQSLLPAEQAANIFTEMNEWNDGMVFVVSVDLYIIVSLPVRSQYLSLFVNKDLRL